MYATQQQMITRFGEREVLDLTDRLRAGVIDTQVLESALAEADAEIDPYLAPRHTLPLAIIPRVLSGFACDIARYRLCGAGVTETEEVRLRYKDAVRFLEKVARGELGLGLDAANHIAKPANTVQFSMPGSRVFDRSSRG